MISLFQGIQKEFPDFVFESSPPISNSDKSIYNASVCTRRPLKDILLWFTEDEAIELVKDLQTFFDDGCLMGAITVDTGNGEKVLICVWKNEDEYYEDNPEAPRL